MEKRYYKHKLQRAMSRRDMSATGDEQRASYLLVELLVHQQVRLGPSSEEPHDVLSHLRAQQLRQTRSRCPGLNL